MTEGGAMEDITSFDAKELAFFTSKVPIVAQLITLHK